MAVNEGSGVASDLANERFEAAIVLSPLLDFGDQFQGHIERAGAPVCLEGQVPAWLGAAGPFEGTEAALQERAQESDLAQGALARAGVPVRNDHGGVHG